MRVVRADGDSFLVRLFLAIAGKSLKSFRYYEKRNIEESVENHLLTLFGLSEDNRTVAYGHLDCDNTGTIWLGLCVAEGCTGKGYGKQMLKALLAWADERKLEVQLTVDESNRVAQCLYTKAGFVPISLNHGVFKCKRRLKVADTLGSLVDKLATVNQKMFMNQELLYEIRRMSLEQFKATYGAEGRLEKLYETLKKACDLNVQRAALVAEFDEKVVSMMKEATAGKDLDDGAHIQRPHKTY